MVENAAKLLHDMVDLTHVVNICSSKDGTKSRNTSSFKQYKTNRNIEEALKALISAKTNTLESYNIMDAFSSACKAFVKIQKEDRVRQPFQQTSLVRNYF